MKMPMVVDWSWRSFTNGSSRHYRQSNDLGKRAKTHRSVLFDAPVVDELKRDLGVGSVKDSNWVPYRLCDLVWMLDVLLVSEKYISVTRQGNAAAQRW